MKWHLVLNEIIIKKWCEQSDYPKSFIENGRSFKLLVITSCQNVKPKSGKTYT